MNASCAPARRSDPCLGPRHVFHRVRRLHRGDRAECGKTRQVRGADDLRVLDPRSRVLQLQPLVQIQRFAIRAVADGVHYQLESRLRHARHALGIKAVLGAAGTAVTGTVAVVFEKECAA